MKEKSTEWIEIPDPHPPISPERLEELKAMVDADPRIRRMSEFETLQDIRPLTPEERAEYDELLRPASEMAARMKFDGGENWPGKEEVDERI